MFSSPSGPGHIASMAGETLQRLFAQFAARGDAPALIGFGADGPRTVGFAALADRALEVAGALAARGVAKDEPVAIFAANSIEWITARFALIALGALCVHCDPEWRSEHLAHAITLSRAKRVFATREMASRLPASAEILLLEELPSGDRIEPRISDPDDEASLFFTSGTTGPPKAVPLTHRNILANVDALAATGMLRPGDRMLLPLPLYHAYPFIIGLLTPLNFGLPVVLPHGVTGPEIARALKEGEASIMAGVPRLYRALYDGIAARAAGNPVFKPLLALSKFTRKTLGVRIGRALFGTLHRRFAPRLRLLASGGAKLNEDLTWNLEALGWETLQGYGLVETSSMAVFERSKDARPGTAGKPGPDTKLRIVPAEGWDQPGTGEVQISGNLVFKGYRDNPEANKAAFTEDGWFRSGDVGFIDADGFLHIVGRVKEILVTQGGKKVSPEDVEAVYSKSPFIHEFAVLEDGDDLVGLVVPNLDALREFGGGRIEDIVRVALAERSRELASHERISRFAITREPFPRTQLGKYQRFALPQIFKRAERAEPPPAGALSDEDRELLERPAARQVFDFLVARFPGRAISPDTSPQLDLGVDSLAWVALGLEMEDRLGVKLSEEAVASAMTVRDLLRAAAQDGGNAAPSRDAERRRRLMSDPKWRRPRGPLLRAVGMVLYAIFLPLIRLYFRLEVRGRDKVPTKGPLLIAASHASDVDPFVIAGGLTLAHMRNMSWSADVEQVFFRPTARLIARPLRMFPVDDRTPAASLAVAAEMLKAGHLLVWFPESWRSPDGRLQNFQPGIGKLVTETGAPVVPCWIEGGIRSMSRTGHFPRPVKIEVRFGAPIAGLRGTPEEIARALHDAVAELSAARS
jgi:long-chain acyl-CoA synthetase